MREILDSSSARHVLGEPPMLGGRYILGEQIGVGGMGVVYAADDIARTQRVAIKILHEDHAGDAALAAYFAREAEVGALIDHPNVVAVRDSGVHDGRPYLVMDHVDGLPLRCTTERLSVGRVIAIVDQILAGLGAIHRAGYAHGDVKTDNVLLGRGRDGDDVVTLIDLGLVQAPAAHEQRDDSELVISGTPDYIAPELITGEAKTIASDLYAVGVILYELLTGTTPFAGGTSFEIMTRHVHDAVVPPSVRAPAVPISIPLERVVMRALEKDPADRFGDADEFRLALRTAMRVSRSDLAHTPSAARDHDPCAPTDVHTRPALPRNTRFAAGTRPARPAQQLIEDALAAARARVSEHRLLAAAHELELAHDALGDTGKVVDAWRLLLVLAAVYEGLGDPQRARRTARAALDHATQVRSETGCTRARDLLARFTGRTARAA